MLRMSIAVLVMCGLLMFGSAAFAGNPQIDKDATPISQAHLDIVSTEVTTAKSNNDWGSGPKKDTDITIRVCMKACPGANTMSVLIKIGGAKIKIVKESGTWNAYFSNVTGGPWTQLPTPQPWDQDNYSYAPSGGGAAKTMTQCCISVTVSAQTLGLPGPDGAAEVSVESHGTQTPGSTPTDTAAAGHARYKG